MSQFLISARVLISGWWAQVQVPPQAPHWVQSLLENKNKNFPKLFFIAKSKRVTGWTDPRSQSALGLFVAVSCTPMWAKALQRGRPPHSLFLSSGSWSTCWWPRRPQPKVEVTMWQMSKCWDGVGLELQLNNHIQPKWSLTTTSTTRTPNSQFLKFIDKEKSKVPLHQILKIT